MDAGAVQPTPTGPAVDAGPPLDFDTSPGEALGATCLDDSQCDDDIDCTFDACDALLGRCRFTADATRCQDEAYCNGQEVCNPRLGCRPGTPVSCSDATPCTVDRCDEATRSCVREPRDADGDGDPDANCQAGADCNDLDPEVSSLHPEICGNRRDDDCDFEADEADCQPLRFDSCDDPLGVSASGSYLLGGVGAQLDLGASCAVSESSLVDFVIALTVPEGPALDVDLVVRAPSGLLWLAARDACAVEALESTCSSGRTASGVESAARLLLSDLSPGVHTVVLVASSSSEMTLEVDFGPSQPTIDNVSCESAVPLDPEELTLADLAFSGEGLPSGCPTDRGERVFALVVEERSDLLVIGRSTDGLGEPRLSLRGAACQGQNDELDCDAGSPAELLRRDLAPGTYFVGVSASGPSLVEIWAELTPPEAAPATDACERAPVVDLGVTVPQAFDQHVDDVAAGCRAGAKDAVRAFSIEEESDVLVLGRFSRGDLGAVSLSRPGCASDATLACSAGGPRPVRAVQHALPAGDYRAVVESELGLPSALVVAARRAVAPRFVPGANGCADALEIPVTGGFFLGNTSNASSEFTASCDFAIGPGAADQLLRLELDAPRRVIFDMRGSDFETLLSVRRGPECPGRELGGACSVSLGSDRSFLDLNLPAGEYFVQIDGYAGTEGSWFLDVFVMP